MTEPTHLGYGRVGQASFVVVPAAIGAALGWGLLALLDCRRLPRTAVHAVVLDGKHAVVPPGSPSGPAPPGRRAYRPVES